MLKPSANGNSQVEHMKTSRRNLCFTFSFHFTSAHAHIYIYIYTHTHTHTHTPKHVHMHKPVLCRMFIQNSRVFMFQPAVGPIFSGKSVVFWSVQVSELHAVFCVHLPDDCISLPTGRPTSTAGT
jgi:hypothetical protein